MRWSDNVITLMRTGMTLAEADKLTADECEKEVIRRENLLWT
jgi:hypothetical protein